MTLVSNDTDDHDEHDDNNDLNTNNLYPKAWKWLFRDPKNFVYGQGDHGHHGDQYPHSNIKSKLTECIAVFMNLTGSAPLAVVNISLSYRTAFHGAL